MTSVTPPRGLVQLRHLGRAAWSRALGYVSANWVGLALAATAFVAYSFFRVRYAGGCDSWAYLSHARVLRGVDVGLEGSLDPVRYPAVVPLCYELAGRNLVSGMPPGYSFELALGGLLGAEFFVSPAVGALLVLLLHGFARKQVGTLTAACLTLLWASAPIVIWGSISVMGDLSAACGLLVAHAMLEAQRPRAAGLALGFSVGIRPTNLLFVASTWVGRSWRQLLPFGFGLAAALAFWFAFGLGRYGPSMFGMYTSNAHGVTYEHFGGQLWFIVSRTLRTFPLLFPLAILGAAASFRSRLGLVIWASSIMLFYAGWRWPYEAWWWTRHVLPAYPALALLSFHGAARARDWLAQRNRHLFGWLGGAAVALNLAWSLSYAEARGLFSMTLEAYYPRNAAIVARTVSRDSLIGALNFSGPLRLYAGLESFRWDSPDAPQLIDDALSLGRPVYVIIEPELDDTHPAALALKERYSLRAVTQLRRGFVLRSVRQRKAPN